MQALADIPRRGGVSAFVRLLAEHIHQAGGRWEITLVGHSMGAIVANRLLRATLQHPDEIPIRDIV